MKRILVGIMACCLTLSCFAKSWRRESLTEDVGYVYFNHVVVYNDSESPFEVNYIVAKPISVIELDDTVVNINGLRNYGLRIYYDYYPIEHKIVVHVAEDKGIEE